MAATSSLYGGGGGIKSIQRGSQSVSIDTGGNTSTATINAVDLSKTFLSVSFRNGHAQTSYASYSYNMSATSLAAGAVLTNTTTLTFYSGTYFFSSDYGKANPIVYWEVIEYE